mgnify:CR=1 FL=1
MLKEIQQWGIKIGYEYGRAVLSDGDRTALKHYQNLLQFEPEFEKKLILELAEISPDVLFDLTERAAIRSADGLPGDIESGVAANLGI